MTLTRGRGAKKVVPLPQARDARVQPAHTLRTVLHRAPGLLLSLGLLASANCAGLATPQATGDPIAGSFVVKGGGAALDVFNALSDGFRALHPNVRFSFEDVGSAAGIRLVASDEVDLATASANPPAEVANAVTVIPVGASATAVIVSSQNPVSALTKAQVAAVFSGKTTDWADVGGDHGRITCIIREATSALRSNFDAYFFDGKGTYVHDAIELNTADQIVRAIANSSSAVSMLTVTHSVINDARLRPLAIDGFAPTRQNVVQGSYPVRRPLFLVYNTQKAKAAIRSFIQYVAGNDGQHIIDVTTGGG